MNQAIKEIKVNNAVKNVTNQLLWHGGIDPTVCLLEPEDIVKLLALEKICFNPKLYSSLLERSTVSYLLNRGNGFILVNKHQDVIRGYAQLLFRSNSSMVRFYSLAVHPDFQGKGIANLLFKSVEKTAVILGADTVTLEIREDNRALKYRYGKLGYKIYRRIENYYPDGAAAIKMKRIIK
jgi:[ribosomal protein S18]-alanine N-acetyltransferase